MPFFKEVPLSVEERRRKLYFNTRKCVCVCVCVCVFCLTSSPSVSTLRWFVSQVSEEWVVVMAPFELEFL